MSMIIVSKKDSRESTENLLRRFNRKVQQAGILAVAKQHQYHKKDLTKRERRRRAIIRRERRAAKLNKMRYGR